MARKYTSHEVRLLLRAWTDGDIRFERDRLTAKRLVRQLLDDTATAATTEPAGASATTAEQPAEPVEPQTPPRHERPKATDEEPVPDVIDMVGRLWRAAQGQVQQQMQRPREGEGTPGRGLFAVPDDCESESPLDDLWKFMFRKLDEQSNREHGGKH